MITRRQIAAASAMFAAMQPRLQAFGQPRPMDVADAGQRSAHDISTMPAHWTGKEQIALLIYPAFTALDMVGPHYMFTNLMGATTHIVAKTMAPVTSDTGLDNYWPSTRQSLRFSPAHRRPHQPGRSS